ARPRAVIYGRGPDRWGGRSTGGVMRIGEIEILPVIDGTARVEPTEAFTGTTDDDWSPHRGLLDENGMLELALGGFLIRSGDRVALIDVGVGAESPLPLLSGGAFLESLSSHGV